MTDLQLSEYVSDEILSVAELFNEVTTSDLQGIAQATANTIIKTIKENENA